MYNFALILPELSSMIKMLAGISDVPVPGGGLLACIWELNIKSKLIIIAESLTIPLPLHCILPFQQNKVY